MRRTRARTRARARATVRVRAKARARARASESEGGDPGGTQTSEPPPAADAVTDAPADRGTGLRARLSHALQPWRAANRMARGFVLGATAGRTTLNGEGLQHEDGHSMLIAATNPAVVAYDPAFAFEIAHIVENGLHQTFWCINPNSGDTGGLLLDDWRTWDETKYALLKPALWQHSGKFVSLDHQVRLGGAGV